MTQTIGGNLNTNKVAIVPDGVQLVTNSAIVLLSENDFRTSCTFVVEKKDAWLRFIPAATNSTIRKGILLEKDIIYTMDTNSIYTGEISIINRKNGEKPIVYVTEY